MLAMASLNEKLFAEDPPPDPRPRRESPGPRQPRPGDRGADAVARAIVESVLRNDGARSG